MIGFIHINTMGMYGVNTMRIQNLLLEKLYLLLQLEFTKKQADFVKELIKGEGFHYTVHNIKDDFDDIVFYKYPTVESMVAKFISRELGNDIEMMLLKIPIHTIHEMLNLNCTETHSQKTSPR